MSIINQASKRLEQLRQAGVELPWAEAPITGGTGGRGPAAAPVAEPASTAAPNSAPTSGQASEPAQAEPQGMRSLPPQPTLSPAPTPAPQTSPALHPIDPVDAADLDEFTAMPAQRALHDDDDDAQAMPELRAAAAESLLAGNGVTQHGGGRHSQQFDFDLPTLAQRKFLVPNCDDRILIDEFRALKRTLANNAMSKAPNPIRRANIILVTSALPGEGKTYCAINLAMSLAAQVDNRVLLIDADVVKPAVSQRLGMPPHRGLLDLLTDQPTPMCDVILRTNIPKFSIIPSSVPRGDSAERVSSAAMDRLLDEMAQRYADRLIVIDAPPLLLTNESRILASLAGQVVMVVEAGKTTHRAVQNAYEAVAQCPVVMSILNKRSQAMAGYGYGYAYGYGY